MTVKTDLILIKNLLCFAEVAKEGQINHTAFLQGMKQPNLSRYIKELESFLHVPLFKRLPTGIELTENGKQLYQNAADIEKAIDNVRNFSTAKQTFSGEMQLWMSDGVGSLYMMDCLKRFYEKYPDVHLKINCSLEKPNSIYEMDMGILYSEPKWENIVVLYKGCLHFSLYASMAYLSQYGTPKTVEDLCQNHKLCARNNFDDFDVWKKLFKDAPARVITTSSNMVAGLVESGLGISLLPDILARKNTDLIPLNHLNVKTQWPFWVVARRESKKAPKVQALLEEIKLATHNG